MRHLAAAMLVSCLALPALAPAAAQPAAPSADQLALGGQLAAVMSGDRDQVLAAMNTPMVGMMRQMGVSDADEARVLVTEAVMPVVSDHYNEFMTIQAGTYARVLSDDDMRAIIAFYNTPAGQDLIKAQPALASARVVGLTQWMQGLQPELVNKIQAVAAQHGWKLQH